jgi:hypothetical protein
MIDSASPVTRRAFVGGLLAAAALGHPAGAAAHALRAVRGAGAVSGLRFEFAPLADLYLLLLKAAREPVPAPADLAAAVARVQRAADRLPELLALSLVGGLAAETGTVAEFARAVPALPETGPGGVPLRASLAEIAEALELAEPAYREQRLPEGRRLVDGALAGPIGRVLLPRERECLDFLRSGLALPEPGRAVPVYLVADVPAPGAFTTRSRRHGAVCVVGVAPHPGSTLLEVVLHEATHALEVMAGTTDEAESVLARVRRRLREAGVPPSDPLLRDVPHTLMFVHAGEAVRRLLDGSHRHYGDTHDYYARLPRVAAPVRRQWARHLDGQIPADEAVALMVEEVLRG